MRYTGLKNRIPCKGLSYENGVLRLKHQSNTCHAKVGSFLKIHPFNKSVVVAALKPNCLITLELSPEYIDSSMAPSTSIEFTSKGFVLSDMIYHSPFQMSFMKSLITIDDSKPNERLYQPLNTDMPSIDLFHSIALGQRLSFIGVPNQGQSEHALRLAENLSENEGVHVVYSCSRSTRTELHQVLSRLKNTNTTVLGSCHSDPLGVQYLVPKFGLQIATGLRDTGHQVVYILDDLAVLSEIWESIAIAGKIAFNPGYAVVNDVICQGKQISVENGGGSLTPIIVSTYNEYDYTKNRILDFTYSTLDYNINFKNDEVNIDEALVYGNPYYQPMFNKELSNFFKKSIMDIRQCLETDETVNYNILDVDEQLARDRIYGYKQIIKLLNVSNKVSKSFLYIIINGGMLLVDELVTNTVVVLHDLPNNVLHESILQLYQRFVDNHPDMVQQIETLDGFKKDHNIDLVIQEECKQVINEMHVDE